MKTAALKKTEADLIREKAAQTRAEALAIGPAGRGLAELANRMDRVAAHTPSPNGSGIQPLEYRVLIVLDKAQERIGSVYIPQDVQERHQMATTKATVIAVGGKAFEDWSEADKLKAGDRVLVKKYAGESAADVAGSDGVEYRLCQDKEVLARLA